MTNKLNINRGTIMSVPFRLVRDAHVTLSAHGAQGKEAIDAVITDPTTGVRYPAHFEASSRVSAQVRGSDPSIVAQRLSGGQFFFAESPTDKQMKLIDFRDNQYNGFTHSDDSLEQLMLRIGVQPSARYRRVAATTLSKELTLSNAFNDRDLSIAEYGEGGKFNSRLLYSWNPFHHNIRAAFELIRLICTNGLVGMANFLNAQIPIIDNWEEHLEIAGTQIQNKVDGILSTRLRQMEHQRASVADLLLLAKHASIRATNVADHGGGDLAHAREIRDYADPERHLRGVYQEDAFRDKSLAARLPGHLSKFDAYNMATELVSHIRSGKSKEGTSTDNALHTLATRLVFGDNESFLQEGRNNSVPARAAFSDTRRAFFGGATNR